VDIEIDPVGIPAPGERPLGPARLREPVEYRRNRPRPGSAPRIWHRLGSRLNFRVENLGQGASVTGIRLSPLPPGALVDWNKMLPATVSFEDVGLVIEGATRRAILDTLASVRIALPRSAVEHPELVLEIVMRVGGGETTAVTTVALNDDAG
jgi:hypothetical protein